jgi:hypothetical protein
VDSNNLYSHVFISKYETPQRYVPLSSIYLSRSLICHFLTPYILWQETNTLLQQWSMYHVRHLYTHCCRNEGEDVIWKLNSHTHKRNGNLRLTKMFILSSTVIILHYFLTLSLNRKKLSLHTITKENLCLHGLNNYTTYRIWSLH